MDARSTVGLVLVFGLAVLVGLLMAQSQPSTVAAPRPTVAPTPIPTPATNQVNIEPNPTGHPEAIYLPSTLTVHVGQKVTWVNLDSQAHNAIADDGAFDTNVLTPGEKKRWTADKPGAYAYGDYLHPDMRGLIIVKP
jgi:plastocyanin